jgi:DNA-binding winged helix-turn-helix (wHTH) protein/pimeloyl-ACP methyl ester carboxylesterase
VAVVQFVFSDHRLDLERRELWRGSEQLAVQPQVFDLLIYLIRHRDRVVTKDELIAEVWNGRIVSDSTLTSRINAVRKTIGDDGEHQRLVRTIARKGIRFVGTVREDNVFVEVIADVYAGHSENNSGSVGIGASCQTTEHQQIHYCRAEDGVRLAYAISGHGPPLVKTANWLNHLEYDWDSPVWRHVLHGLSQDHTLVRYDARGSGLSDWDVAELSLDAWVTDLDRVVAAAGAKRFPLLGISQGCAISIAYAVRYPERVSHLILYGGFVLGAHKRSPNDAEKHRALTTLTRLEWGADSPAFRQIFTLHFMPDGSKEQIDSFNELQRRSTSPECAARYLEVVGDFDVTEISAKVTVPTLVMHARGDLRVPFELGQHMAARIPNAKFVALQSRNHLLLENEPAAERFFEEIRIFLGN